MITQEQIKLLIKSGFDPELISLEFDLPIETIKQANRSRRQKNASFAQSKIKEMRGRYVKLYSGDSSETKQFNMPTQEELEFINDTISDIDQKIKSIENFSGKEKINIINLILKKIQELNQYQLPLEQGEQLFNAICSEQLDRFCIDISSRIESALNYQKRKVVNGIAQAIDFEQSTIFDIETLKALNKRLTPSMIRISHLSVETIKSKILKKISSIQKQQSINKIRFGISTKIEQIIEGLADGNIDIRESK